MVTAEAARNSVFMLDLEAFQVIVVTHEYPKHCGVRQMHGVRVFYLPLIVLHNQVFKY